MHNATQRNAAQPQILVPTLMWHGLMVQRTRGDSKNSSRRRKARPPWPSYSDPLPSPSHPHMHTRAWPHSTWELARWLHWGRHLHQSPHCCRTLRRLAPHTQTTQAHQTQPVHVVSRHQGGKKQTQAQSTATLLRQHVCLTTEGKPHSSATHHPPPMLESIPGQDPQFFPAAGEPSP